MSDNVLEPYTFSFGDANPASIGCSSRVWVSPTSILQCKRSRCIFNDSLMNDAVYKFKRYEDASLSYTGIDCHEGKDRGGWDTVLSDADYKRCSPCSRHLWKPLRLPRTICLQSPISLRTRTSQNQHGAKHTGFRQQNPQAEQQLYTPPGFRYPRQLYTAPGWVERWHWSSKAELWSEQPTSHSAKTACQGGCFQNQGWCQGQA